MFLIDKENCIKSIAFNKEFSLSLHHQKRSNNN